MAARILHGEELLSGAPVALEDLLERVNNARRGARRWSAREA